MLGSAASDSEKTQAIEEDDSLFASWLTSVHRLSLLFCGHTRND